MIDNLEVMAERSEQTVDALFLLSPEQKERAEELTAAMAEKFSLDEADFSVLATETGSGEQQFTVAYTAGKGIHKGSCDKIMDPRSIRNFTVEIDGRHLDTRTGMTRDVYNAMIEQARSNGETLPDSRQLSDENGQPWTWTLRTSEQAGDPSGPEALVVVGGASSPRYTTTILSVTTATTACVFVPPSP